MTRNEKRVERIRNSPNDVKWADLIAVCDLCFGKPRRRRGSHLIYDTPWMDHPLLVLQPRKGKAKPYQVRQALRALDEMKENDGD
ncbi:MAG: toxin HicA [Acidimicrobiia bacterium]|nr:toxin HicA [Acidimicrobiia bacterium]MYB75274.1 toxin HicA [Acidimicrobiia bacterium]MYH97834.1 toxin HicA [Acidimicrobiia bacterium]